MFKYEIDSGRGILQLTAGGFMSSGEVDHMNSELTVFVEDARRRFGLLRMLTDAREAPVQAPEVSAKYKVPTYAMRSPDDRLAIVVSSVLLKLQTDRALMDSRARAFLSIDDARAWLKSDATEN